VGGPDGLKDLRDRFEVRTRGKAEVSPGIKRPSCDACGAMDRGVSRTDHIYSTLVF
jgi:hypothetical protein